VDAYYSKVKSAVSSAPLTAAQVALLPGLGYSVDKSLAGTISDNTTFSVMALYNWGVATLFASYEHMKYADPANPLPAGFNDIGGYTLAFVSNTAYVDPKILNVYWGGLRYTVVAGLDLTAAFYGVHQNAYGTGAIAGCSTNAHAQCSGWLQAYSFDADYRLTKRFDVYAGLMYSSVHGGFANGYTLQTNNMNPTVGIRFRF
jgi:predicted porin